MREPKFQNAPLGDISRAIRPGEYIYETSDSPCAGVCVGGSPIAENFRLYLIIIEAYRSIDLKEVPILLPKPETREIIMHFAKESLGALCPLDTLRFRPTSVQALAFSLSNLFYSSRPRTFGPEGK